MRIKLIALSEIDGSRRSTQLDLIWAHFKAKGRPAFYLWTRGRSRPGIERLKSFGRRIMGKYYHHQSIEKKMKCLVTFGYRGCE